MKTDKNTFKGLLFFFLRLLLVALVCFGMLLAYDFYRSSKYDNLVQDYFEVYDDVLHELTDRLK